MQFSSSPRPSIPPCSTVDDDGFHLRRSFPPTAPLPLTKRSNRLHHGANCAIYDVTPHREPHERDTRNPRDDIMSFPGMGGGLPGMPGGGAGNVDPNDPNAVQMVR